MTIAGAQREWRTTEERHEFDEAVARSLWLQGEIAMLRDRIAALEAMVRALVKRMDEREGNHK